MSVDLDRRIAEAVRAIADEVPVTPPPIGSLRAGRAPRTARLATRRWPGPLLAAAAVLTILALVAVLPGPLTSRYAPKPGAPDTPPTLPSEFAPLSLLTASVSASPPGPAIALYRQGSFGTRYFGGSQVVVVGVDGRTYRHLDLAERRGATQADNEWSAADALLSPDGTAAAVADPFRSTDRIDVVDLRTGKATGVRIDPPAAVRPLDWSPDGRRLAVVMSEQPPDQFIGDGDLAFVDLRTGAVVRSAAVSWQHALSGAAFSPDGALLAVEDGTEASQAILLIDATGAVRRTLPITAGQNLAGGEAWSPDGRLLTLIDRGSAGYHLAFLDVRRDGGPVPAPIPFSGDYPGVLAWRSATSLVVGASAADYELREVPRNGEAQRIGRIPEGLLGLDRVHEVQLAAALVPGAEIRDAGSARRGPWPWWLRLLLAGTVLTAGVVAARTVYRRRAGQAYTSNS